MTKAQFLAAVSEAAAGLPPAEIGKSLEYYGEMIDDRMEDGMTEEEAVAAMGTVEETVEQMVAGISLPQLVREKVKPAHTLSGWEIVLLVLGSPLWLPLCLAAAAVFLSVYVVIWAVIFTLYAVDLSFAVTGLAGAAAGAVLLVTRGPLQALLPFGAAMICAGLAILLFFAFGELTRLLIAVSKNFLSWVKSLLIRKGEKR